MQIKKNVLLNILYRPITLYLLAALVLGLICDQQKANVRRLNNIAQWSNYPILFSTGQESSSELSFWRSIRYFQILTKVMPKSGRGEEMIGYCFFYLKDYPKAEKYFTLSQKKHPEYFWLAYDLGAVAYARGNLKLAEKLFRQILETSAETQLQAAKLSSLTHLLPAERVNLNNLLILFVIHTREQSGKMILQLENQKTQSKSLKEILTPKPVIHPWAHFIPIGRENFL